MSAILIAPAAADEAQVASIEDLRNLSIEQLANLEIISVSKRPSSLASAAASIYVITAEAIRRAGATSVPEALRLAPNLQVARLDSATYAITARGFNHQTATANKLLVLIDGRTVYTPLYSGVFWDSQFVMLADIDRIEVISGPGGTLWGSNAVNGVINIVTRSSRDTQGAIVKAGYGNLDKTVAARYGGALGDHGTFRIFGAYTERGPLETRTGHDANDNYHRLHGGFRADWAGEENTYTVQGDIYDGEADHTPPGALDDTTLSGGNVLARWGHQFSDGSDLQTQIYYDNARRTTISGITTVQDTYDIDSHYSFGLGEHHAFVLGGGYRWINDSFTPGPATAYLIPAERTLRLGNVFVQDDIALLSNLTLTLGLKLEDNSYTGLEYMPDARLAWRLSDTATLWSAVSRAVRTPSRFDHDLYAPGNILAGGPHFESEDLLAYEVGYRGQPLRNLSLSVSAFYNDYDNLRTVEATVPTFFPLVIKNNMAGHTYGVEAWATYDVLDWWRLSAGFNTLTKDLHLKAGSTDAFGVGFAGNDPDYQVQLHSWMNFGDVELDLGLRGVDSLPNPAVPSYVEADARIGWRVTDDVQVFLSGTNLLHDRHLEFVNGSLPAREVPRAYFVGLIWRP